MEPDSWGVLGADDVEAPPAVGTTAAFISTAGAVGAGEDPPVAEGPAAAEETATAVPEEAPAADVCTVGALLPAQVVWMVASWGPV